MPTLPPELLERVFAQLSKRDLISVALTSRLCYQLSLILLYRKIDNIQLFGLSDQAHLSSLKCLQSLSSPGNGSLAVRHFAARGHPWLQVGTVDVLLQALLQMTNLVSLELDMGVHPETQIFTESRCSEASFLPRLRAISTHHHKSAAHLMKGRSVESARIKPKIDMPAFSELLAALRFCSTSLTTLQVWVTVPDVSSALTIMESLPRELPLLRTLGIVFTFPAPNWAEHLSLVVKELINPLRCIQNLTELGLAMIPDLHYLRSGNSRPSDLGICFDVIRQHLPQLRIIEVQWEASEIIDGSLQLLMKHHPLMRRKWRYLYANKS